MAKVVPLNSNSHKDLKVSPNSVIDVVKGQHIVNIRVTEISKASACMPVFLNKYENSDDWAISSITSLELNKNLFVVDDKWTVNYLPNVMRTYPFFLVGGKKEGEFTVGIDEDDKAFNKESGVNLFDEEGNSTPAMKNVIELLETDIAGHAHTRNFVEILEEFDLIKPLTMRVKYQGGQVNSISGLKSIDEKKLQELNDLEFIRLRKTGFLAPIYALILSVFQLNELMKRHNQQPGVAQIVQVMMEAEEDNSTKESEPAKSKPAAKKKVSKKSITSEAAKKKAIDRAKKKAIEAAKTKTPVKAKKISKATKKVAKKVAKKK